MMDLVHDDIIEADRFCIFCRGEKARTRRWPRHWRHIRTGMVICEKAINEGRWPKTKGWFAG